MAFIIEDIDEFPEDRPRRRNWITDLLDRLESSATGKVRMMDDNQADLDRRYKTLIQWRSRHKDLGLRVRKRGEIVYVWLPGETSDSATAGSLFG